MSISISQFIPPPPPAQHCILMICLCVYLQRLVWSPADHRYLAYVRRLELISENPLLTASFMRKRTALFSSFPWNYTALHSKCSNLAIYIAGDLSSRTWIFFNLLMEITTHISEHFTFCFSVLGEICMCKISLTIYNKMNLGEYINQHFKG